MIIGIIDLGSNSARMTIFKIDEDKTVVELQNYRKYVRLSEGMGEEKLLKDVPIHRTILALRFLKSEAQRHSCDKIIAVTTAAVRIAKNRDSFISLVKSEINIDIRVLSGKEESHYDFLSCIGLLKNKEGLILDVGGGSFELILAKDGKIANDICLPYGAVMLTEQFKDEKRMYDFCFEKLNDLPWLKSAGGVNVIGLGGSSRALRRLLLKDTFSDEEIFNFYDKLGKMSNEERKALPEVGEERGDILLGGLVPFVCLMKITKSPTLIVSDAGVRDGILYEIVNS